MISPWTIRCIAPADADISSSEFAGIASLILFEGGALAVGETETASGETELTAGFSTEADARATLTTLRSQLPIVTAAVHREAEHDQWVLSQRAGLEPVTIGPWTIRAPWHEPSNSIDTDHDVIIDPGAAFGHGAHPSTRLSIELMLRELNTTSTVADLGTGTGVIAIIAALAGHNVRATEYDDDAVAVARANVDANNVANRIELTHGDAADSPVKHNDLVVANVTIDIHRLIAGNYRRADRIIVAGLLCNQVSMMRELLPDHRAHTIRTEGDWAAASFLRTTPS